MARSATAATAVVAALAVLVAAVTAGVAWGTAPVPASVVFGATAKHLGVPGIVPEEWCLVPLSVGGITLGLGMVGEVAGR